MFHVLVVMFHLSCFFKCLVSTAATEIAPTISEPALGPSSHQAVTVRNRRGPLAPPEPYTAAEGSKAKRRKKAKKVKLDEIDEIFS